MGRHADVAMKEALGCFVMLLLVAFMTLGVIVLVPSGIGELLRGNATASARSIFVLALTWVAAPAIGIALVAWLTYGRKRDRCFRSASRDEARRGRRGVRGAGSRGSARPG
jgi:hypothetical protein